MPRKNLILLYRGPEYENDFREIAEKTHALDPDITVFYAFAGHDGTFPKAVWTLPTLTIAFTRKFKPPIERGPILRNRAIDKLDQQEIFRKNGIPTPHAAAFEFGKPLDPILFGDFVILKPRDPKLMSRGTGIHLFRRGRAEMLSPGDFPDSHPIRWSEQGYLVQRFVYTGERATTIRVTTLMGEPILAFITRANALSPPLIATDTELEAGDFTQKFDRYATIEVDPEALAMSAAVSAAFPDIPLLGIDFVRDVRTGELSVLEVNAGGNTWHFSSLTWAEKRAREPDVLGKMIAQFGAFDAAARVLVRKVHELAA